MDGADRTVGGPRQTLVVVTLRPAQPADTPAVARVWHDAWHDGHRGHVPEELLPDRDPAYFEARAAELVGGTTLAEDGGELLGVAIVVDDELSQLMVSGAARGRGVGGLLIADVERQVAAAGHREAWLAVVPGNATARRFYAARGWVDHGPMTYPARTLAGTTVPVPVLRYVKEVAPQG